MYALHLIDALDQFREALMGDVVQLASEQSAEAAWEAFRAHAQRGVDDPSLALDFEYMKERRRLERRWYRLFDRIDA